MNSKWIYLSIVFFIVLGVAMLAPGGDADRAREARGDEGKDGILQHPANLFTREASVVVSGETSHQVSKTEAKGRATYDPDAMVAPGASPMVEKGALRQFPCGYTGNSLGPWNFGSEWIADMAFNPITQTVYQVEVGGSDGIIEWVSPPPGLLVNYCPDPGFGVSQRGIAYDSTCNLLYVGGWNDPNLIYAVTPPPGCRIKYAYPSPLPGISGLAYDDSCQTLWIISNGPVDSLCQVDPANGMLISGPFPVSWMCPHDGNDAAGLAYTKWIYNPFGPSEYCPGLFAPNQCNGGAPANYSEILDCFGVSHGCCQLVDPTTHGWGVETFDVPGMDCHWLSQVNPSTWMDNCHYRPELLEPMFWYCEPFLLAPRDLQCGATDTCCLLTWTNPIAYDYVNVYRSWGLRIDLIDVIPGDLEIYWDSTCTCTGNWDYFVTGVVGLAETGPSNTCICVKAGEVQYFWDFNIDSTGGTGDPWTHYSVTGAVDDWQYGSAPFYRPDTLYPQALTCWECGDTANDPVPLDSCWGTVLNGPYSTLACCKLVSPWVEIDSCSGLLQICHWHEFEDQDIAWDGGNIKIHVWPDAETQYLIYPCYEVPFGYQDTIRSGYDNCLAGQYAFARYSYAGLPTPANTRDNGWRISYFDLRAWLDGLGFNGRQTIQFAFHFGSDNYATEDWGWYIKWAKIFHCPPECEPPPPPQDLGCSSTDTCIVLVWSNPVEYDSIAVFRSWGGVLIGILEVLPGSPERYHDTTCCCTGNYDYHLVGYRCGSESDPSETCWVYKRGYVQYSWDFNESDQGWMAEENPPGVNSWQWGPAAPPHDPGEPTCPPNDVADPAPLTNYWGTIIGGPYLDNSCCRLYSPEVELDSCALLEICHWYNIWTEWPDGGNLKVSADTGVTWDLITPCEGYPWPWLDTDCHKIIDQPGYCGSSPGWVFDYFDLAAFGYGNKTIQIAFDFGSLMNFTFAPGWYVKWAKIYSCCPCGDCNGDGTVTFADALYLKNYYYQTPPGSPPPICNGDVNLDGFVNFADALYIKNYYYQTPPGSPPPCQPPKGYSSYSDEPATVTFSSPRTENGIVEIPVCAGFGVPSEGVHLEVTYDHTALEPLMPELTSRTEGLDLCCNPTLENGRLLMGVLCLTTNELIQPGDGAVVIVRFNSLGDKVDLSSLRIERAIVVDEQAREMKTTVLGYPFGPALPSVFSLTQNYPNPFWNETLIRYALPGNGQEERIHVLLELYDTSGRLVRTLVNEHKQAGYHTTGWDCRSSSGDRLPAGVYFYRLSAEDFTSTKKMILLH